MEDKKKLGGHMDRVHTFTVSLRLPENLKPLKTLAYNLWFAWNAEVRGLFRQLDRHLWEKTGHNPVLMLSQLGGKRIEKLSKDMIFLSEIDRVYNKFKNYLETPYFTPFFKVEPGFLIAYFSAEFGLTDCLPIYSGGLGILAGDHLKSASDLNFPMVGVGLLYQYGYFKQTLTAQGNQREDYLKNDFYHMPLQLEKGKDGRPILITVTFKEEKAAAQIWRVDIGRVRLYLLDTNIPQNPPHLQNTTFRLYNENREIRLRQEILLGIGGVRALDALGISPTIYHLNEGHSALAGLERIWMLREKTGISFDEAYLAVTSSNIFTTHTSVPAGIEAFDPNLVEAYARGYIPKIGISMPVFLGLGRKNPADPNEPFCMNIMAMKLSGYINAVSKLHQQVSQKLWHILWPRLPEEDVPIRSITNAIHVPSWISHDMEELYNRYLGPHWSEDPKSERVWERIMEIPDEELWGTHSRRRERLVAFCDRRLQEQLIKKGTSPDEVKQAREILNPQVLTLVWARRIAIYKRPTLIFKDPDRLANILNHPNHPVQIIIAGKPHPADNPAKDLLKQIIAFMKEDRFRHRLVFVEDYDVEAARYFVQGADVWLNTPLRPNEACGTSGMKAIANGVLHFSTADGWWARSYKPDVGWLIGSEKEYEDPKYQEELESNSFYNLLEHEIAPLFYDRGANGLPHRWIQKMKIAMHYLCPKFNAHRMLEEYMTKSYESAFHYWQKLTQKDMEGLKLLSQWKNKIMTNWNKISILSIEPKEGIEIKMGEKLKITTLIRLEELTPEDIKVEIHYGPLSISGEFEKKNIIPMNLIQQENKNIYRFEANLNCIDTGKFGYRLTIIPSHPYLISSYYLLGELVIWG